MWETPLQQLCGMFFLLLARLWHKSLESMGMWDEFTHFLVDGPGMHLNWSCNDEFSVFID